MITSGIPTFAGGLAAPPLDQRPWKDESPSPTSQSLQRDGDFAGPGPTGLQGLRQGCGEEVRDRPTSLSRRVNARGAGAPIPVDRLYRVPTEMFSILIFHVSDSLSTAAPVIHSRRRAEASLDHPCTVTCGIRRV